MGSERQNVVVQNSSVDKEFTVKNIDSSAGACENAVDVLRLEWKLNDRITKAMSFVFETVEDRIHTLFWPQWMTLSHQQLN